MAFPTTKESMHYSLDDETVPNIIAEFSFKFELAKLMVSWGEFQNRLTLHYPLISMMSHAI